MARWSFLVNLRGPRGYSAYEEALVTGAFQGSYDAWRLSLKGEKGNDGRSAYEVALATGAYAGPEISFVEWLKGRPGQDATPQQIASSVASYMASNPPLKGDKGDKGDAGLSAYQVARAEGYGGTQTQWLATLKGETGANGTNATTTAVATASANGLMSKDDKAALDALAQAAKPKSAIKTTAADGTLRWTFAAPFPQGVVPVVSVTAVGTATVNVGHVIIAVTNNYVDIRTFRNRSAAVALLGLTLLELQAPVATVVHLTAQVPTE